ncbi:MAG: hypothetical protein ACR2H0_07015 [Candidatus Limnocylindrales bacterium]
MLTGLHTHNNGVIKNEAVLFDPSEHIGAAMKDAGYASMFIGKYLNCNDALMPEQWLQHDAARSKSALPAPSVSRPPARGSTSTPS